ncbi:MAG: HEAT repeat domain-containing protein, partial [Verrucomicrobiota bacterium]
MALPIPYYQTRDYLDLLEDEDHNLQYLAMINLVNQDVMSNIDPWVGVTLEKHVRRLLKSRHPKVRAIAAFSLSTLKPEVAHELLPPCFNDSSSVVRVDALKAWGRLDRKTPEEIEAAFQCLDDKNSLVRMQAIEALRTIGDETPAPNLFANIERRIHSATVPEQIAYTEWLGTLPATPESESLLEELALMQNDRLTLAAVSSLVDLGSEWAAPLLFGAMKGKIAPPDQLYPLVVRTGTPESIDYVARQLHAEDLQTRMAAISALPVFQAHEAAKEKLKQGLAELEADFDNTSAVNETYHPEVTRLLQRFDEAYQSVPETLDILLASDKDVEQLIGLRMLADRNDDGLSLYPGPDAESP